MDPLSLPPEELRRLGYHVVDRLVEHHEGLDGRTPVAAPDPGWSAASVPPFADGPSDPQAALDYLFDEVLPRGQLANHPRFFARIGSPSNPLGALADLAATGVNAFAGSWTGGAGVSAVELAVVEWLREAMGMPPGSEGVLVSGGSVGTLTALAAAAHARLDGDPAAAAGGAVGGGAVGGGAVGGGAVGGGAVGGGAVGGGAVGGGAVGGGAVGGGAAGGLARGARGLATAYASEHAHAAVERAWRVLGFTPAHLRRLPADAGFRLPVAAVADAIAADRAAGLRPFCVVGTAGTTSTGSVDPLDALADLAAREGLWLHVDGAYGAPARLTDSGRAALTGIERADSLVIDPHKWLFQPYEIGCLLVREPGLLERAFTLDGAYLRDTAGGVVDFRNRGLQLTRGPRGLKLWLSLRVFGVDAFRAAIGRGIALAEYAEARLRERPGWEVVAPAQLAIVCFRRLADGAGEDALNDRIVAAAVASGYTAPSTTVLNGRTVARLCTINPRTTEADVLGTLALLERLAA